ncbi:unnamed protein product [Adineta steineri]|uniref:Uncharacterized protein n=1 Tax=Adineta steineri TaxID=433720 RepID=A0A819X0W4_9BILA|nr:unnamed protein product [Adineta steineri]CAF4129849.1 unnamed protein product [Adineta steineri]CAF4351143.1 unnamed protein product [Adineta steineri]
MVKGSSGVQCLMIKNEYYQMKRNPLVNQSRPLLSHDKQTVEYQSKIITTAEKVCSKTELEHYVCYFGDLSNYQSCNLKILQKISEDDGKEYYKGFIRYWKTTESKDNQKLTEYFSKH